MACAGTTCPPVSGVDGHREASQVLRYPLKKGKDASVLGNPPKASHAAAHVSGPCCNPTWSRLACSREGWAISVRMAGGLARGFWLAFQGSSPGCLPRGKGQGTLLGEERRPPAPGSDPRPSLHGAAAPPAVHRAESVLGQQPASRQTHRNPMPPGRGQKTCPHEPDFEESGPLICVKGDLALGRKGPN